MLKSKSDTFKWILYDWANSVFATTVVAALFPIMLKKYWASHLSAAESTYYLGLTNSLTSLVIFILALFTGYLVDHFLKKPQNILFLFASLGSLFSISLAFIPEGRLQEALLVFSLAFIFFALGNTIYDSLLLRISFKNKDQKNVEKVSSYGYLAGYLGGGVLLLLQALLIIFHKNFGLLSATSAVKISFISVGLWWLFFSYPLLSMKLKRSEEEEKENALIKNKTSFLKALSNFYRKLEPKAKWFLLAYFLYIDVVFTTYKMAIDFGLSIGLSQEHLIGILIYVQFIGAPGTLVIQKLSDKTNTFFALIFGLCCYGVVLAFSPFVTSVSTFLVLASLIGLSQGGVQSLSRAYFAGVAPQDMQGMSFGIINLVGKASAILGPIIVGYTALLMGSNTYSVIALLPVLFIGCLLLVKSSKV